MVNILPYPKSLKIKSSDNFKIKSPSINIYNTTDWSIDMQYVEDLLSSETGLKFNYVFTENNARIIFNKLSKNEIQEHFALENIKYRDRLLKQSYLLDINKNNIVCSALTKKGLLNSIHTLLQILKENRNDIQGLFIKDFPLIPYRGIMLDISRGKIPTVKTIKDIVDFIARYKMNVLQLYMEDSFYFPSNPGIGRRTGRLTGKEIKEIDLYCQKRGIELQPNIQTFSHFHNILRHPDYYHLSENDDYWTLAPGSEESYKLLRNMLKNLLGNFSCDAIHLNMDEAYDIGTGYSKEEVNEEGKEKVYLDHLIAVRNIVREHGINKIFIWGDMINKNPGMLKKLPGDITIIDWHYEPAEEYTTLDKYKNSSHEVWSAAGTSSWNTIFPRINNAKTNISKLAYSLFNAGGEGFLLTDWGDYGHYQPLGMSFYTYILGAEAAWNCNNGVPDYFEDNIKNLLFTSEIQYSVWNILAESAALDNISDVFKSKTIYAFFDDILKGRSLNRDYFEYIREEQLQKLFALGRKAYIESENLGNSIFAEELKLVAWMTYFTGKKGKLSWEIKNSFAREDVNQKKIFKFINKIKDLYQELEKIRQKFSQVWDLRARFKGKEITMFYFSKTAIQLSRAVIWLNEQRKTINENIDTDMNSYKGAEDYTTLWTQDFKNMWDISYPWS